MVPLWVTDNVASHANIFLCSAMPLCRSWLSQWLFKALLPINDLQSVIPNIPFWPLTLSKGNVWKPLLVVHQNLSSSPAVGEIFKPAAGPAQTTMFTRFKVTSICVPGQRRKDGEKKLVLNLVNSSCDITKRKVWSYFLMATALLIWG